jgi:urate oxidase
MDSLLTHNSYGKSGVRMTKVVRNGPVHELFEIDAAVKLEGDFEAAYRDGDNRNVVATDTIKNTVYVLAKQWTFNTVESFAKILVDHFIDTYPQVVKASVELRQSTWRRIEVDGEPHGHAFHGGGPQQRYAKAIAMRGPTTRGLELIGGVRDMLVLKTTGSEWRDFHDDEYRTLRDTRDRVLSTKINGDWRFVGVAQEYDDYYAAVTNAILTTFATQHSLGVQHTILAIGEAALAACGAIDRIALELPNLHRIPFNFEPLGMQFENDVYVATDEPYGLIRGTVMRSR